MFAESSEKKMSHARVAFALLCGLAVCCSVMYITADAGDEYMHETVQSVDAGTSVGTTDVLKAGQIYTETPDGRMRLMDYFNNVEKEISDEVANRKADIASVRAQMARDFAFDSAARAQLKTDMLHKMATNAKIARRNLDKFLRESQRKFAQYADLYNKRQHATEARDQQTLKYAADDKREAQEQLQLAVSAWQKSTSAWAAATNQHIDKLDQHVAANAAQIVENAKRARKDLENTMHKWDTQVTNFRTEEANANSQLHEQFAAQDKATRAWANNKVKTFVASTASQFNDVETKMAKNRHDVDMALRQAAMRFNAALSAAQALEDERYAETVANIAAAKAEAKAKVESATADFKVKLLTLSSTVKEQVSAVNSKIDAAAGVARSDAAAQAKVNANVNAEMSRMIELGNKQYTDHLKHDTELQTLINKDKAETDKKMNDLALQFNAALADIRKELAADRAHAESELAKSTSGVFTKLYADQTAQEAENAKMQADIRRMRLDAMDAVREAKGEFQKKIKELAGVVAENDQKADEKVKKLTGVVGEEAAKSRQGREQLAALEHANKEELKASISAAIAKGEKRAQAVEDNGKKMDDDTKWLINNKLKTEIDKLRDETNAGVETLALQSPEAREEMKKEMLYAVRSAAEVARTDLDLVIKASVDQLEAFNKKVAAAKPESDLARKNLNNSIKANAEDVSRMIQGAVSTDARAQLALATETAEEIKKTNTDITAKAEQMKQIAAATHKELLSTSNTIISGIAQQAKDLAEYGASEDTVQKKSALDFIEAQLKVAADAANAKFGAAYLKLADARAHAETGVASAIGGLNDALAKQAALADSRFEKTVTDISAARKQAAEQVSNLRKEFGTEMTLAVAESKRTEQKLVDNISKVSGEVISLKANQIRVNLRVTEDLTRVETIANHRVTQSTTARGKLRMLMDENKQAAAEEVKALADDMHNKIHQLRHIGNVVKIEMQKDLTAVTTSLYEKLSNVQKAKDNANAAATAAAESQLARAQTAFDSKIIMLVNEVSASQKTAKSELTKLTGVVHDANKANEADRKLIQEQSKILTSDLDKSLNRAISIGEANAKAIEERIAQHLSGVKRFLQVEFNEAVEETADGVLKGIEGKRQKIADNYLSLKAYATASADVIEDTVVKGHGRALSSIGDFLVTVGALGPVKPEPSAGIGMGGDQIALTFSGGKLKVSSAVAAINGLVDEYTNVATQVRMRWPMGLGKYLLDKLEESMLSAGVLQVDKVEGKSGNFVFINGRSVGLSNKMFLFPEIGSKMTVYESTLAKLTSTITGPPQKAAQFFAPPPEWDGA